MNYDLALKPIVVKPLVMGTDNVSRLKREKKIETYSHAFCGTFLPAVFISSARYKRRI